MTKQFEFNFSEIQADMVAICLEYVNDMADDIYIYCSYEQNLYKFDVFYKVNNQYVHKHELNKVSNHKYNVSLDRQKALMKIGLNNLKLIHQKCQEFNQDMPTEIKLHYNVKENSLKGKYKYDAVYSNHRSEEHTSELQSRFDLVCRL